MRAGITLAWLAGLGIVSYRTVARQHHPPLPGQLLAASGLFALLALLAEYQPAAGFAAAVGWGFDLAALLNVLPGGIAGPSQPAAGGQPAAAGAPAKAGK